MADGAKHTWITQRELQTGKYDNGDFSQDGKFKPYIVSTKPLFSTLSMRGDMVLSTADPAGNKYGFIVFRPQLLNFFEYGIGDQLSFGTNLRKANASDTNLSKGKLTNGAATFVIEGLSLLCGAMRAQDSKATAGAFDPFPVTGDADVDAAIDGARPVVDPGSIFLVPQQYSPFNLENAIMTGLLRSMAFQINWDQKRIEKIGQGFYLPQGGGGSELRSNGVPLATNVAKIPEGYLWAPVGKTDSELTVDCQLNEAVVVPVTFNESPDSSSLVCYPSHIWLDLTVKLHGIEFKFPSGN